MIEATIEKLITMKLHGMADAVQEQIKTRAYKELGFEERLGMLVDREMDNRQDRKLRTLLAKARLRYPGASVEDINFRAKRGITKEMVLTLTQNGWIKDKRNIIITGSTGVGKTYMACALGNSACRAGISAYYVRLPRLFQELKISKADGSYGKLLQKLSRVNLLIVDDWGLSALTDTERRDFLEIMEDRYNVRSTIISSQIPVEKWHDLIGEPTLADAICDRLIHNAHKLKLTGKSMRGGEENLNNQE
ncbi:MAG: IS21-like element helper ATPase IstB [Candidatus Saccharibacteria bacterium]|nr:IS21-like element helper ATPase IstB [Candidatus Saccharibacteria bacterium]